jgi:hypothetical protein
MLGIPLALEAGVEETGLAGRPTWTADLVVVEGRLPDCRGILVTVAMEMA